MSDGNQARAITPERVAAMKVLCETATPGPWQHDLKHFDSGYIFGPDCAMVADRCENCEGIRIRGTGARLPQRENAAFIAESRTFVPDLLEAYAAATQWRDMASAPKDGTEVLLRWDGCVVQGHYLDFSPHPIPEGSFKGEQYRNGWVNDFDGAYIDPQCWLPLPAPPVQEER